MRDDEILSVLRECADSIGESIEAHRGRGYSGLRDTQYHLDLAADEAGLRVLLGAGFRVVSEESGVSGEGELTVVIDPIDGSTNCDRGIPFYATSLAVLHQGNLVAGMVVNQATKTYFEAVRGCGATRDGELIRTSGQTKLSNAVISFSGLPDRHLGWSQVRSMGAASLECCLVADGSLDAYAVAQKSMLHPWDYLAGLLIAEESGAAAAEYRGESLVIETAIGRRPIFASSVELLSEILSYGVL